MAREAEKRRGSGRPCRPEVVAAVRGLVEGTTLPFHAIAARAGVCRDTVTKLRRRHGWSRPRAARVALAGQRGGGHPIVPEVVARAAALVENTDLSLAAIAQRIGVARTTLGRWRDARGWRRPPEAPSFEPAPRADGRARPTRYPSQRGRPYAADAVETARALLTGTLLSQAAIAARLGVSKGWVGRLLRRRGWARPPVPPSSPRFAAARRHGALATEGDRRGRPYAPELRREARVLWEETRLSTALIGARLGVRPSTVSRWARVEGWRRPAGRVGARQLRGLFGSRRRRPAGFGQPRIRLL